MRQRTLVRLLGVGALAFVLATAACSAKSSPSGTGTASPPITPVVSAPVTAVSSAPAAQPPASSPDCQLLTTGWTTDAQSQPRPEGERTAWVEDVKLDQKNCFDVVTFTMSTSAPIGFDVKYVNAVTADASDKPVPVTGKAVLQVIIYSWDYCHPPDESSPAPPPKPCWTANQVLGSKTGATIQQVKFAGSNEAQTTFAVGVSDKLNFSVVVEDDVKVGVTRVNLFVAHTNK